MVFNIDTMYKIVYDVTLIRDNMDWLQSHRNNLAQLEKQQRAFNKENMLKKLKEKHFLEKTQEIESLKKRIKLLEMEIENYQCSI
jgi:hypothetical protein